MSDTSDITIGRIVHYTLNDGDAAAINGTSGQHNNQARAGDVYPAVVVRVWTPPMVNLQVFYDGNGSYWATSRKEGDNGGEWCWPPRKDA